MATLKAPLNDVLHPDLPNSSVHWPLAHAVQHFALKDEIAHVVVTWLAESVARDKHSTFTHLNTIVTNQDDDKLEGIDFTALEASVGNALLTTIPDMAPLQSPHNWYSSLYSVSNADIFCPVAAAAVVTDLHTDSKVLERLRVLGKTFKMYRVLGKIF
ncbi:hypothetical protein B0H10DRAFT_2300439 [Mycena sp. CBHHK59/15]|nr:hypothetical protein B0H10DRAFT_2300439 [Mycena sp. CBHHK59/15]